MRREDTQAVDCGSRFAGDRRRTRLGCGETGPVREPRETIPASVLVRARPPRPGEPPAPLEQPPDQPT